MAGLKDFAENIKDKVDDVVDAGVDKAKDFAHDKFGKNMAVDFAIDGAGKKATDAIIDTIDKVTGGKGDKAKDDKDKD